MGTIVSKPQATPSNITYRLYNQVRGLFDGEHSVYKISLSSLFISHYLPFPKNAFIAASFLNAFTMMFQKNTTLLLALAACLLFSLIACVKTQPAPEAKPTADHPQRELRHVVMFKFKDGTPQDTVHAIEAAFKGLKAQIPTIQGFEWGTNNSPEKLDQGYTHCFVATFASEKDRDDYLPCAAHQAFVNRWAKLYVDKVCVLDFWAER